MHNAVPIPFAHAAYFVSIQRTHFIVTAERVKVIYYVVHPGYVWARRRSRVRVHTLIQPVFRYRFALNPAHGHFYVAYFIFQHEGYVVVQSQ